MAGHGPAPKPGDQRARRNKGPESRELAQDGELRGFPLPRGHDWPDETKRWWINWRKSAQAQTFLDSDWDFLLETALLHARFWGGDMSVAGELRLRVGKFGATPEDRLRLRMKVTDPGEQTAPESQELESPNGARARYGHLRMVATGD